MEASNSSNDAENGLKECNSESNIQADEEEVSLVRRRKPIKNKKVLKRIKAKVHVPSAPPPLVLDEVYPEELLSKYLLVGYSEFQGKRETMEDAVCIRTKFRGSDDEALFGLFDGHGGSDVSQYAAAHFDKVFANKLDEHLGDNTSRKDESEIILRLLRETILDLNDLVSGPELDLNGGSTVAIAYIRHSKLYIANAGDSRIVLGKDSGAQRLTIDHRPTDESEARRIEECGGFVRDHRVNGLLAVSRSLGDSFLSPMVTAEPYMQVLDITSDDLFLIIACDGLWDVISDSVAVSTVKPEIDDPRVCSTTILNYGWSHGSTDNISVIIVKFNYPHNNAVEAPWDQLRVIPPVMTTSNNHSTTPNARSPQISSCASPGAFKATATSVESNNSENMATSNSSNSISGMSSPNRHNNINNNSNNNAVPSPRLQQQHSAHVHSNTPTHTPPHTPKDVTATTRSSTTFSNLARNSHGNIQSYDSIADPKNTQNTGNYYNMNVAPSRSTSTANIMVADQLDRSPKRKKPCCAII